MKVLLGFFGMSLLFTTLSWAGGYAGSEVYDGGHYSDEKVEAPLGTLGGRTGNALPYVLDYMADRDRYAPENRTFYVFAEDNVCLKAKFSSMGAEKELVVYSQPTFTPDHCIYQKKRSHELSGFSVFVLDGGLCMPTFSDGSLKELRASPKDQLQVLHYRVSFRHCLENTVSYGDVVESGADVKTAANKDAVETDAGKADKTPAPPLLPLPRPAKVVIDSRKVLNTVLTMNADRIEKRSPKAKHKQNSPKVDSHKPDSNAEPWNWTWAWSGIAPLRQATVPKELPQTPLHPGPNKTRLPAAKPEPSAQLSMSEIMTHKYTIQLASCASTEDAQRVISQLKEKGVTAFELRFENHGHPWHRVCSGTFDNMPSAQKFLKELADKNAFVQMIHPRE